MSIVHSHPGHGILSQGPRRLTVIADTLRKMSPDQGRPAPGTHRSHDEGENLSSTLFLPQKATQKPHKETRRTHTKEHSLEGAEPLGDTLLSAVSHTHQLKEAAVLGTTRVGREHVCVHSHAGHQHWMNTQRVRTCGSGQTLKQPHNMMNWRTRAAAHCRCHRNKTHCETASSEDREM